MPTRARSRSRSDVDIRKPVTRRDSYEASKDRDTKEKKHRRRGSSSRSSSGERRKHRSSRKENDSPSQKRKHEPVKPAEDDFKITATPAIRGGVVNQEDLKDELGDFRNFPEIGLASQQNLISRGITRLFAVQYMTFRRIVNGEDLMVRDLTGSGKTLGFCLPMIEMFRS